MKKILPVYAILTGILVLTGCTQPVEEGAGALLYEPPVSTPPDLEEDQERGGGDIVDEFSGHMAIVEYQGVDFREQENLDKYSRARVLVINPYTVWSPSSNPDAISTMKSTNPDLRVLGYFNAQTSWLRWGNDSYADDSYQKEWYEATRPYWSYTTEGDTMMAWPGKVVLNILDENCRSAMIGVLSDHWTAHSNVFDGIMWDHFNEKLWVMRTLEGRYGDLDLDGDGIPHNEDEDEMAAYRDASVELVTLARQVLGNDIIQVPNGARAGRDSAFAALVDGSLYENFPDVGFAGDDIRMALDPDNYNNLFAARNWMRTENGGPYLILLNPGFGSGRDENGDIQSVRMAEFSRVVAIMTRNLVTYHPDNMKIAYGWPEQEVSLGLPLGPVTIEGDRFARDFENGSIWLDFTGGSHPSPFSFEITQNGEVVQAVQSTGY